MGYDLHITRAKEWTESEESPITNDEWLAYVRGDPEFHEDGYSDDLEDLSNPASVRRTPLFGWRKGGKTREDNPCFSWSPCEIVVKNPDEKTIKKMLEVARVFSAKVIGDDGEIYSISLFGKIKYSE